jgi:hypothetical protein
MHSKIVLILLVPLALAGCMTAQERAASVEAAARQAEAADDNVCKTARDYAICRQNLMSQRRNGAIVAAGAASGDVVVAGPPHHWSLE